MSRLVSAHLHSFVLRCVTVSATTLGCAANTYLARMDPLQRIETEDGYRQHGERLDVKAMGDALEHEQEAGPLYIERKQPQQRGRRPQPFSGDTREFARPAIVGQPFGADAARLLVIATPKVWIGVIRLRSDGA